MPSNAAKIRLHLNWLPWASILGLPFVFTSDTTDPYGPPRVAVLALMSAVAWVILRKYPLGHGNLLPKSATIAGLFFFGMGLLSALLSFHLMDGLMEWGRWVVYAGYFILLLTGLRDEETLRDHVWKALTVAGLFLALVRVAQYLDWIQGIPDGGDPEAATLGNVNFFAGAMVFLFPAAWKVAVSVGYPIHWRGLAALTASAELVLVIFGRTSGAWVAMAAVMVVIGIGWLGFSRPNSILGRSPVARLTLLLLLLLAGMGAMGIYFSKKLRAEQTQSTSPTPSSERERLVLWEKTVVLAREHPLLGVGPGHWPYHILEKGQISTFEGFGTRFFMQAHNDFLQVFSEWGIPAGLAFLFVFGAAFYRGWRAWRLNAKADIVATWAGLVGWATFACFNLPAERPYLFLLLMVYMALGYSPPEPPRAIGIHRKTPLLTGAMLLLTAGVFVMNIFWAESNRTNFELMEAKKAQNWGKVLSFSKRAEAWYNPHDRMSNTPIAWYQGTALLMQGQADSALPSLRRAYAMHPWHPHVASNFASAMAYSGMASQSKPRVDSAILHFDELVARFPAFDEARRNLIQLELLVGDTARAAVLLSYWDTHIASPAVSGFPDKTRDLIDK